MRDPGLGAGRHPVRLRSAPHVLPADLAPSASEVDLGDGPVMGQVLGMVPKWALDDPQQALSDPGGAVDGLFRDLVHILAQPQVDAYSTLIATADKGWKSIEVVMDKVGVQDPDTNCVY